MANNLRTYGPKSGIVRHPARLAKATSGNRPTGSLTSAVDPGSHGRSGGRGESGRRGKVGR